MAEHVAKTTGTTQPAQSLDADDALRETVGQLREAAAAKKCWPCGCLHQALAWIGKALPEGARAPELDAAIREARAHLAEVQYDCLGCEVCYPALAINALSSMGIPASAHVEICPSGQLEKREGWPPFPGSYTVLRYRAGVAVCTLTDEALSRALVEGAVPEIALVGTIQTENLGIERLIQNVVANPNIRFLVVCGADSRQAVGHLPGQALVSLVRSGLDERGRIVGAMGKRPVIRNISRATVEHFRRSIEIIDLIGSSEPRPILEAVRDCAAKNPGPAEPFGQTHPIRPVQGYIPDRMVSDPAGYFLVFVDRTRVLLSLEHYSSEGVLNCLIEGRNAAELYFPAIERKLISRLDHAAYLGRELARAEQALKSGEPFVQDAAAEKLLAAPPNGTCECPSACEEDHS